MANRRCIKCDQDMERQKVLDVEVDFCPRCKGLWLDHGEIRQLASDKTLALSQLAEVEKKMGKLGGMGLAPEAKVLQAKCPACAGKLGIAKFGLLSLEVCTSCQGTFLDRGELEKAMQVVEAGEAATIVALARSMYTSGTIGG